MSGMQLTPENAKTNLFGDYSALRRQMQEALSQTVHSNDPEILTQLVHLKQTNLNQLQVLEKLPYANHEKQRRETYEQLYRQEEQVYFAVKEFFSQQRSQFDSYYQDVTNSLLASDEYRRLYERVKHDQEQIKNIEDDIRQYNQLFLIRDAFQ